MNTVYVDDGTPKFVTLDEHLAQKKSYCLMSWDETGIMFFSSESGWGALSEETDLHCQTFPTFVVPPMAGQPVKWIELEEAEALVQVEVGCDEDLTWRDEVAEWRAQGEREEQWDKELAALVICPKDGHEMDQTNLETSEYSQVYVCPHCGALKVFK